MAKIKGNIFQMKYSNFNIFVALNTNTLLDINLLSHYEYKLITTIGIFLLKFPKKTPNLIFFNKNIHVYI